jgi:hypothetical protein
MCVLDAIVARTSPFASARARQGELCACSTPPCDLGGMTVPIYRAGRLGVVLLLRIWLLATVSAIFLYRRFTAFLVFPVHVIAEIPLSGALWSAIYRASGYAPATCGCIHCKLHGRASVIGARYVAKVAVCG